MLLGLVSLPLLCLGLLSPVLVDIKKTAMEGGLCGTVPCVMEFSKASLRGPTIVSYRLNENLSFRVGTIQPRAPTGDVSTEELEYCILMTHNMLRRENMTYSLYVGLGAQKDLTQNPELHIPESGVSAEPVTLTCTMQGTCQEPKALFLSWKGPSVSSNTTVSVYPSSALAVDPKPEDQGTALRCHLKLSLDSLSSRKVVKLQLVSPARLLSYSCSLKRTLTCSCSFHGIPTPSVQWWVGRKPVSVNSIDGILHTTTSTLEPWTNSTIHLVWEPEIIRRLRCEGKNRYGVHTSRIFLVPDKSSISSVFLRGLIQGIVYGTIASALFLFFLVVLILNMPNWREENQTRKNKEGPTLQKPVLGGANPAEV